MQTNDLLRLLCSEKLSSHKTDKERLWNDSLHGGHSVDEELIALTNQLI